MIEKKNREIKPEPDLKLTFENHQNIMERK